MGPAFDAQPSRGGETPGQELGQESGQAAAKACAISRADAPEASGALKVSDVSDAVGASEASNASETPDASNVLVLESLGVHFTDDDGLPLPAVQNVSFALKRGSVTCLVGESGCGKSLTARACLGLVPRGGALSGRALYGGRDLLALSEKEWQGLRGSELAMIFQEPMTALNPVLKVGMQAAEPLRCHRGLGRREARERVIELFEEVGIPSAADRFDLYPHELSGGMRQRVMIAMSLSCEPAVLFADEPTTALDATIQGQILAILDEERKRRGMSVLLITHDLGVVAQVADTVGVMYAGHLVEWGSVEDVLRSPAHPYTRGLMTCDPASAPRELGRLNTIPGSVPTPGFMPKGCPFHPRCREANDFCRKAMPREREQNGHRVLCWQAYAPETTHWTRRGQQ